jgi:hypothetical protein
LRGEEPSEEECGEVRAAAVAEAGYAGVEEERVRKVLDDDVRVGGGGGVCRTGGGGAPELDERLVPAAEPAGVREEVPERDLACRGAEREPGLAVGGFDDLQRVELWDPRRE